MLMKYLRGKQTWKLEEGKLGKARLQDVDGSENIWVVRHGDEMVLQNHTVAFMPYYSWGMVLPNQQTVDVAVLKEKPPTEAEFEMHPEAWDDMLAKGDITRDGVFVPPTEEHREPQARGT
jgi:hypothetical protein